MQVYIELAVLENFCMDYTLLYSAKLVAKNPAGWGRVALGAVLGAVFAVLSPYFPSGILFTVSIKAVFSLAVCFAGGKFGSFKAYLKFTAVFLSLSALLAGMLYGVFSLAGLNFLPGSGYVISSVPVGIPLFGALCIFLFARFLRAKFKGGSKSQVKIFIGVGEKSAELYGFFDSGNNITYMGKPVSVIPLSAALKLTDVGGINRQVNIHTVSGSKKLKVFSADILRIEGEQGTKEYKDVILGVSAAYITAAVLNPDILEE